MVAHAHPVRTVRAVQVPEYGTFAFTGSKDHTSKCFALLGSVLTEVGTLVGHSSSVESLDVNAESALALTGDWNGNILGWQVRGIFEQDRSSHVDEHSKKKKKGVSGAAVGSEVVSLSSAFTIHGHSQSVAGLCVVDSGKRAFTCSYDHSIKVWDLQRQDCVLTLAGSKACTSISHNSHSELLATSHPDGKVRVWDSRQSDSSTHAGAYGTGKQWISQTCWCPSNDKYFASVDYEGVIALWDIRTDAALAAIEGHDGKGLCLDFCTTLKSGSMEYIATGGSDCILRISEVTL